MVRQYFFSDVENKQTTLDRTITYFLSLLFPALLIFAGCGVDQSVLEGKTTNLIY